MSGNRLRFVWPLLCLLLIGALVGRDLRARKKVRAAESKAEKKTKPQPVFDKRDSAYFRALAESRGYDTGRPLQSGDAARLAAYDRIELNKSWALLRSGEPATTPTRDPGFTQHTSIPLAPTMQAELSAPLTLYRWELRNKSDRTQPAPIVYQENRWESAEALVAQAGFAAIPNERERALAIWRYVCAQRVFGDPPTEGEEEHDVLKFLACYGYGFCDDSARAVATLADLSGLRGRVWALEGHLVAEVFADGHWRMLDADQQAYFHRANAPLEILSVDELAADPRAFDHLVSYRGVNEYSRKYRDCFLSRENNEVDEGGTHGHRLQPVLRAGERMTMTNYNWGRYFLGKYPTPPPRFYNGFFTYAFRPADLVALTGKIDAEPIDDGHRLTNSGTIAATARLDFAYPFPIVGGRMSSTAAVQKGTAAVRLEEADHDRVINVNLAEGLNISLDHFVSVLASEPTSRYALIFTLEPGAVVELRNFQVTTDFQFAQLPLLRLQAGANLIRAHFPKNSDPAAFELVISTK